MKLIDVASSIKSADDARLDNISVLQIQRILSQGLREVRSAVQSAGDEVVVVPGLGRFRSRTIELKNAPAGEDAGQRRVTKFVAAKDKDAEAPQANDDEFEASPDEEHEQAH